MTKTQLLKELALRIDLARQRSDWRSVELHTAAWLRINQTRDLSTAGLAKRIAARAAAIPLDARLSGESL